MSIRTPKWPFVATLIHDAPATSGVYALWDERRLLYIGCAHGGSVTLRTRLLEHLCEPRARRRVKLFSYEITSRAAKRETDLLSQFEPRRLPRWNRHPR